MKRRVATLAVAPPLSPPIITISSRDLVSTIDSFPPPPIEFLFNDKSQRFENLFSFYSKQIRRQIDGFSPETWGKKFMFLSI